MSRGKKKSKSSGRAKSSAGRSPSAASRSGAKPPRTSKDASDVPVRGLNGGGFDADDLRRLLRRALSENRPARVGLILSGVQFAAHCSWIAMTQYAVSTGAAKRLSSSDPLAWAIVISMGLSMLLTLMALFVCMFFGLRREPRVFAVMGIFLSFFTGAFATFAVLLG